MAESQDLMKNNRTDGTLPLQGLWRVQTYTALKQGSRRLFLHIEPMKPEHIGATL